MNKTILVGNLSRDPQFNKTQSGISVARLTVVTNRKYGDKEEVAFVPCVAWRQSADFVSKYAKKGSKVAVEGHITTGSYVGENGKTIYTQDVTIDHIELIGGKSSSDEPKNEQQPKAEPQDFLDDDGVPLPF